jgi:hypothetical protein
MSTNLVRNTPCPEGAALGAHLARMTEPGFAKIREHSPHAAEACWGPSPTAACPR